MVNSYLRLCKPGDFQLLFKQGRSLASTGLVLYYMPNQLDGCRVAFCVGKNFGNAVKRNRTRRRMREAFRSIQREIIGGYDLAWVARKPLIDMEFSLIIQQMISLMKKSGVIGEE